MSNEPAEPIGAEESQRLSLEIVLGRPPAIPDTPALAAARKALTKQILDIHAAGGTVDFPLI